MTDKTDYRLEAAARHWYIAVVKNTRERYRAAVLAGLGYECYVPSQQEIKVSADGKRRTVDRIVIPARVFVRVTKAERIRILKDNLVLRFVTDIAGRSSSVGRCPVAIVPDCQMETLRFMLFNADRPVTVIGSSPRRGDRVRVVRGRLRGLEGIVQYDPDGRAAVYVSLDILGSARVEIDRESVEVVCPGKAATL